jgi:DNA-binding NarL/FixJ family response regulator
MVPLARLQGRDSLVKQMEQPYRILLAEDHIIFREMIKKGIKQVPGLKVVGEVSNGQELLESIEKLHPHMVILDIGMPRMSGLEAAKKIKETYPEIKIILLTMHKSKEHLTWAFEVGVDGYLTKENAYQDLIGAIESVRKGKTYISHLITKHVMDIYLKKSPQGREPSTPLSNREIEILQHFGKGKAVREIADLLLISEKTVRIHITNIKKKLSMRSTADLVRYAIKKGYSPFM